ncbi:hypothetical protein B0H10DRAFT_2023387 [Mycena sp. CBHHK59/15]|nr:hypothetical protein B0H10DRAFT_2023387 [Mycena sp. CBHHK59/15]
MHAQQQIPTDACRAVKCDKCGKTTWAVSSLILSSYITGTNVNDAQGCGQHIESVMKDVKEEDRCVCPRE